MSEEIRLNLIQSLDIAKWPWLTQHLERGTLFIIDNSEEIINVAYKIATDDAPYIKALMDDGKLKNPTEEQKNAWNEKPDKDFQFIIVQPYVLIKEHFETQQ